MLLSVAGTAAVSMAKKSKAGASSVTGLAFLAAALACDGIVGGTQKGLKKALAEKNMKERNFEMQFLTNLYMALTAIVFTFVMGEFGPGCQFLLENPAIFKDILMFAACSAVGQAFIFYTISLRPAGLHHCYDYTEGLLRASFHLDKRSPAEYARLGGYLLDMRWDSGRA